ncbi:putative 5-formyltetrahydrofolate cyclo-ligase [Thalassoglobus neptunius]|uniref:5-formyltetrahydrofolate cyclo-ligase n=1 Tax=Thalassoglobus neptunius TaxID=1938619 RepID=A0A5C5X0C0_9PLAN|nr:5-formyltetrahydrofolate cyclo-ligase [Thalassoglobus neptunius]TWT55605.1 putative 5-formyltetrahydrofolate cyclo-ligase [Thalassoglobus neptunius]
MSDGSTDRSLDVNEAKKQLRQTLRAERAKVLEPERLATAIFERLKMQPEYAEAGTVLFFVGVRSEVPTRTELIAKAASGAGRVAVPYCFKNTLKLVRFTDESDLIVGKYGIPEPRHELRKDARYHVPPEEVDLALLPGLGFDRCGNRLGYGAGYYDRLIPDLRSDCLKIGLAYDCQIVDRIPAMNHDGRVDWIVTPTQLLKCE